MICLKQRSGPIKIMKPLTIYIHSFVDLITNSSTEIYISATDKTIESIEKLVDNILSMGHSEYKCRDLFEISIDIEGFCQDYDYEYRENKDETPEQFLQREIENSGYDNHRCTRIKVIPKTEDAISKDVATVLSSLTSLFNIDAAYNG